MKRIKLLLCAVAIIGLGITSCSDDDDSNNNTNDAISGTYLLTELNTQNATDLNMDGTSNFNQRLESNCYNNSRIVLNNDNTFTYYSNGVAVDVANGTMNCNQNTYSGTWVLDAGTANTGIIIATYMLNGNEATIQLNKSSEEITNYQLFVAYPDRNASGAPIYTTGEVTMIFQKS